MCSSTYEPESDNGHHVPSFTILDSYVWKNKFGFKSSICSIPHMQTQTQRFPALNTQLDQIYTC